jgi:hypothetical protein
VVLAVVAAAILVMLMVLDQAVEVDVFLDQARQVVLLVAVQMVMLAHTLRTTN